MLAGVSRILRNAPRAGQIFHLAMRFVRLRARHSVRQHLVAPWQFTNITGFVVAAYLIFVGIAAESFCDDATR